MKGRVADWNLSKAATAITCSRSCFETTVLYEDLDQKKVLSDAIYQGPSSELS